jgi:CBS domain-containing protein
LIGKRLLMETEEDLETKDPWDLSSEPDITMEFQEQPMLKSDEQGQEATFHESLEKLTVGEVLGDNAIGCKLLQHYALGDAASALVASGRTAAAVADADAHAGHQIVGLLTENDVMRAFYEGASPDEHLGEWLQSGLARGAPEVTITKLTVRPTATIVEAAERMASNAISGNCSSHHVLVQEEDGTLLAVLSSLDLMEVLCSHASNVERSHQSLLVKDVMKPRANVYACPPTSTMKDVLKVLLLTQQNGVLIVDEEGVYGIITPRDAVRAFSDGEPNSVCIADWMRGLQTSGLTNRIISGEATVAEAAALMSARKLQHLIVVPPGEREAVGVLSSLDLVYTTSHAKRFFKSTVFSEGPKIGDFLAAYPHLTAVCSRCETLGEVADSLMNTGRTAAAIAMDPYRLITDNDVMQAFIDGWTWQCSAEKWLLLKDGANGPSPKHVMVPPSVPLTEAAALMLNASSQGRPCHHLVIKQTQKTASGWAGVFSALDVARGLCSLGSNLEVARTGADESTVSSAMKPISAVPTCRPDDTLLRALSLLVNLHHGMAVVVGEDGTHMGVITARCASEAMSKGIPLTCLVADWLHGQQAAFAQVMPRLIPPTARLFDAATVMVANNVHHLIVAEPTADAASIVPLGVLSSLDLARGVAAMRSSCPFVSLGWLRLCRGPNTCAVWAA